MQLLKFVSQIQKFANLVHTDKYKKVLIPLDLFLLSAVTFLPSWAKMSRYLLIRLKISQIQNNRNCRYGGNFLYRSVSVCGCNSHNSVQTNT